MNERFTGFTRNTFSYLKDLADNNNKEWFEDNRDRYEADWLEPAQGFVDAVTLAMETLDPPHKAVAKVNKSIRRINRDVRFSKDKTPYNARLHLVFWTGDHPNKSPAIHFVLHPDSVGYGAGEWAWDAAKLETFRRRLTDPGDAKALQSAISTAEAEGCECAEPELKKVPDGYAVGDDLVHHLRRKSLVLRTMKPVTDLDVYIGKDGIDRFAHITQSLAPLNRWLCEME